RHRLARIEIETVAEDQYDIICEINPVRKTGVKTLLSAAEVLAEAKEDPNFKGKKFKIRELYTFLRSKGWATRTAGRRVQEWKNGSPKELYVLESSGGGQDSMKDASFDPSLLEGTVRKVLHDNRGFYGYNNFDQESSKGITVIKKGLIMEADPAEPTGYKYGYRPGLEDDKNYLKTQARFRCKRTQQIIAWGQIHMGHHPVGASEHWNSGGGAGPNTEPGHKHTREYNATWNGNTDNYWGPEEKYSSKGTGSGTEGYLTPGPPDSHPMWWDTTHPDFRER
ncbi:MAG TPA: hypothetical protein VD996_04200, partial [Chitinophagaceae bacterium]|nr:hypothetical protein [Chitinophagaceae bacterium]